jgi:glycosyltransferase involved in cell wall biosynthesis
VGFVRILIVTFDPPRGSGGIEGRTMAYTAGLLSRAMHVEVAALAPGQNDTEEPYLGTRLVRLSASILQLPRTFQALVKMMSRSSLDSVFLLSGGSTPLGIMVLGYSRITRRKSGVFFYGRDILQATRRPTGRIALMIAVVLAERVATNSRYTASLLPYKPRTPLVIIYPGVDPSISGGLNDRARDNQSPRILFVGRLVKRKGADLLVTAFGKVKSELPGVRLDIVGDGPELENLKALAHGLGLDASVSFYGALYGSELWKRYAEASLFVLPSRRSRYDVEGFGTVFLEAGVFGVPSVGTRTGGIPEAVIDGITGILVDSEDPEGLSKTIQSLLENPVEMERLGRNARLRISEFSWDSSTSQVLRLLGDDSA